MPKQADSKRLFTGRVRRALVMSKAGAGAYGVETVLFSDGGFAHMSAPKFDLDRIELGVRVRDALRARS